ncbi:hypothetical protein GpartN1_g5679.t1 [Galdieria partita]|uniref:Uncharacterized protein n=1 Tax=Galdieria partita TaxID=83374 RepID=A0A9C7PZQ6_9RHOD|nr:hypothetical protein GpartN1_g5679.t1 [Galdieria partita]
MECFSLRLIENEVVREWLMGRNEVYIPPHLVESSVGICGDTNFGNENERLHFLMRPVGVVDNILIGLKLGGTFQFALPEGFSGVATCKRFVVDLKSFEKLEFHWFSNNTVLVDWMKFPTSEYRIRYLVLFEAPPPGKLPSKLLRSSEIISTREQMVHEKVAICGPEREPHLLNDEAFKLCNYERDVFLDAIHYMMRSLGVFHGSLRITDYQKNFEKIVPIRTAIHVIRSERTEHLKMSEMMNYSVHSPLANKALRNIVVIPTGKLKHILEKEHFMDEYRRYEPYAMMAYVRRQFRKQRISAKRKRTSNSTNSSSISTVSEQALDNLYQGKAESNDHYVPLKDEVMFGNGNSEICLVDKKFSVDELTVQPEQTYDKVWTSSHEICTLSTQDFGFSYEPTYFIDELYDMFQERSISYDFDETELLQNFS